MLGAARRCYKQLKKHLKRLPERGTLEGMNPIAEADAQALSETEAAFVRTLNADVQVGIGLAGPGAARPFRSCFPRACHQRGWPC